MSRRDIALGAGLLLLLVVGVLRIALPERADLRPLSIESIELQMGRIDPGQTVTRERDWLPPDDVYVLGWNAWIGAPATGTLDADLMLYDGLAHTAIFLMSQPAGPAAVPPGWRSASLPPGTGYRARKNRAITFRCRISNTGASSVEPRGTTALVYFVPVAGN
jgi:hypothetical protein